MGLAIMGLDFEGLGTPDDMGIGEHKIGIALFAEESTAALIGAADPHANFLGIGCLFLSGIRLGYRGWRSILGRLADSRSGCC